ncbi:MAG: InlB B-repeat-containing protein [Eubacteriaceae bacterium]|nr:InlB B-repeat-containing protein [Eubacteriaceae bacterium]
MKKTKLQRITSMLMVMLMLMTMMPSSAFTPAVNAAVGETVTLTLRNNDDGNVKIDGVTYTHGGVLVLPTGSTVTIEAVPVKPGKVFKNWVSSIKSIDKENTNPITFTINEDSFINTKFGFRPGTTFYTVTFNPGANGVLTLTDLATQEVLLGGSATDPGITPNYGWQFAGWDKGFTNVQSNLTVNATYTKVNYTVAFESNGGTDIGSITAPYDTLITAPAPPEKIGYDFAGWFKDAGLSDDWLFTSDKVAGDTTLYAMWTINQYTVGFESNGGSAVDSITTNYNTTIIKPTDPTKSGYTFAGWYKDAALTDDWLFGTDQVTENTTLYAAWEINQYAVSFDAAGGSPEPGDQLLNYGSNVTVPTVPTKTGYTFDGWFTEGGVEWNFATDTVPADNLELTAYWTINQYTASFEANGGTPAPISQTIDFNSLVVKPAIDPEKDGYTFTGWFKNEAGTIPWDFTTDLLPASDVTIYAGWAIQQRTITFISNGGTSVGTISVDYNSIVTAPPIPTKEGYTFAGWFTEDLTNAYTFGGNLTESITLYAKWVIQGRTITFETNGGSTVAPITVEFNTPAEPPTEPTKEGYDFSGWFTDTGLTDEYTFEGNLTTDMTLYAAWDAQDRTITFDSAGGSAVAPVTVKFDTIPSAPATPVKTGSTFAGWYEEEANEPFDFAAPLTENKNLIARWISNVYIVTFDSGEGTFFGEAADVITQPVIHGGTAVPPTGLIIAPAGYHFTEWSPSGMAGITGAVTYVALFEKDAVIVPVTPVTTEPTPNPTDPVTLNEEQVITPTITTVDEEISTPEKETTVKEVIPEKTPLSAPVREGIDWMWWLLLLLPFLFFLLAWWNRVKPIVEGVADNGDGTFTVTWGYNNRKIKDVKYDEDDSELNVLAGTIIRGEQPPVEFERGRHENVFTTIVNKDAKIEWNIKRKKALADVIEQLKKNQ